MSSLETANPTSSRNLVRSTLWSLAGQIAPGLVAIVVVPFLIRGLGTDRFGVLSLSWLVVGYFSLFDLGTGRALTKLVADRLGIGQRERLGPLIWTALIMMALLGVIAMLVAAVLSRWLVFHVLKIPLAIQNESLGAFYLLAISLPFVITSTGLRGVLEGLHRFDLVNIVRVPQGMLSFIAPLLVLPFTKSLVWIVASVILVRILNWIAVLLMCLRQVPELRHRFSFQPSESGPLFRMGGWMTVSNVATPVILQLDRLLIGSLLTISAVAYYATPFDVLIRLSLLSGALATVLFPAFAMTWMQDRGLAALRLRQANKFIFFSIFPIVYCVILFAPEIIALWIGHDFSQQSAPTARIIAFGTLVICMTQIPFAFLQAAGRADLTGKFHLIELPLYVGLLWLLIDVYGLKGAAIAFVIRACCDAVLVLHASDRLLRAGSLTYALWTFGFTAALALPLLFVGDTGARLLACVGVLSLFIVLFLWKGVTSSERELFLNPLRRWS